MHTAAVDDEVPESIVDEDNSVSDELVEVIPMSPQAKIVALRAGVIQSLHQNGTIPMDRLLEYRSELISAIIDN